MSLIDWEEKYSVGIAEFDNQHKKLIDMLNDLYEAVKAGEGKSKMSEIIEGLVDYTIVHLKSEEAVFDKYDYPDREEHKAEHQKFVDEVAEFQKGFENGSVTLTVEVMNFMRNWLFSHIFHTDKKYSAFLMSNGLD